MFEPIWLYQHSKTLHHINTNAGCIIFSDQILVAAKTKGKSYIRNKFYKHSSVITRHINQLIDKEKAIFLEDDEFFKIVKEILNLGE